MLTYYKSPSSELLESEKLSGVQSIFRAYVKFEKGDFSWHIAFLAGLPGGPILGPQVKFKLNNYFGLAVHSNYYVQSLSICIYICPTIIVAAPCQGVIWSRIEPGLLFALGHLSHWFTAVNVVTFDPGFQIYKVFIKNTGKEWHLRAHTY